MAAETTPLKVMENARTRPDQPAYRWKEDGEWKTATWATYGAEVTQAAKGLIALGFQPGNMVNILGFNKPEWVIFDVAAMAAGGVPAGIYATNSPDECKYIINHSEAFAVLVENEEQWHKIRHIRADLPHLKKVITMKGAAAIDDELVMSWDEFMAAGDGVADDEVTRRIDALDPEGLATLIYTSGTTGPPKAVMLSHDNLSWTASTGARTVGLASNDENLSYLPLSHIAEQMFTIHLPAMIGSTVSFAESVDKLADNIKEVRPTYFAGVPRVWEKFYSGVVAQLEHATGAKAKIAEWAMSVGRKANAERNVGREPGGLLAAQEKVADKLVLSKVRAALGLDRCHLFITAAAPISQEILEFFSAFFVVNEIYGQSEGSGPTTLTLPGKTKFGSVGVPWPGAEVKIADDGEILLKGRNVFLGYYKEEAATKETLIDGWLQSGDLGQFDSDGFLHITGRKKDIIITAGGKNVAPKPLESGLKNHYLVSEAVVIGDRRKYLTALVTLEEEAAAKFMEERTLEGPAHECQEIRDVLQVAVDELNNHFARVEQLKKFAILPRQLSIEGGELTPTLKVKRNKVAEHFAEEIELLYAD